VSSRYEYLDGLIYTQKGRISFGGKDSFDREHPRDVRLSQMNIQINLIILILFFIST